MANSSLASRLLRAVKQAGVAIDDVSIGSETDRTSWRVQPVSFQAAAQATIDSVDLTAAAVINADLDAEIAIQMDSERLTSAVVWTIIDTYSPPATVAKYTTARTKIVSAFKLRPWIP